MIYRFKDNTPSIADDAFIAPGARVIGRVTLHPGSSVWYNAVLRGDMADIEIGEGTNVQDNTVVHVDEGLDARVGKNCTIGHSCIIHGATIADNCLIGMHSTVLNGVKIGEWSLVGAGSLLTEGKEFPPRSVIMGRPARVVREVGEKELARIRGGALHYQKNAQVHKESVGQEDR